MSTVEDFENAPVGATATYKVTGGRAMKVDDGDQYWITLWGSYLSDVQMALCDYTLDPLEPWPTSAREALDLAWELAHEVKPGQVIPKGTRYLEDHGYGMTEITAQRDFKISPGSVHVRTFDPLPEPEPEWLDAPAVLAETSTCPDRKVWIPESGGVWKCSCCRDEIHWYELVDVNPLYPKETEA